MDNIFGGSPPKKPITGVRVLTLTNILAFNQRCCLGGI